MPSNLPRPASTSVIGPGAQRVRVLVVTLDTVADQMAGPAIRAWEMARALSDRCEVVLGTFGACTREGEGFRTRRLQPDDFRAAVASTDVLVVQGYVASAFPWLQRCPQVIVVDLYDPFHLEALAAGHDEPLGERRAALGRSLRELEAQISRGDYFLCASEKQRDFWLGHLAAAGRVNPETFDSDPSLESLISVVPFGVSREAPRPARRAIREGVPGVGPDDPVLLWAGGVYNWFDPLTLIRAVDSVRVDVPDVRLVFLGMKHPNPDVPETEMARRARELSDQLGLTGRHVIFNENWVPYDERVDYLTDADVGVSCHLDQVETAFSFRTRILDYLWAGLPIVCTAGDTFARLVEDEGLGRAVPPNDVAALAAALREVLADDTGRAEAARRVGEVAQRFTWPRALEPLVTFCAAPRRAADAEELGTYASQGAGRSRWVSDARALARHWRAGGARQVVRKVSWRLRALSDGYRRR